MSTDEHASRSPRGNARSHLAILLTLALMLAAGWAVAQTPSLFGTVNKFKVPEFYPAPNQKQLKSLVQGAVAEPDPSGDIKISQLRVETYREDGSLEGVVEAPQCIYNLRERTARSAGPIEAQTGDGQMRIQGEGFLLTVTNKSLTISNNVRTVIRDLGNKPLKP